MIRLGKMPPAGHNCLPSTFTKLFSSFLMVQKFPLCFLGNEEGILPCSEQSPALWDLPSPKCFKVKHIFFSKEKKRSGLRKAIQGSATGLWGHQTSRVPIPDLRESPDKAILQETSILSQNVCYLFALPVLLVYPR